MQAEAPRYIVGIDLGTTHTVVACTDRRAAHDRTAGGTESDQTRPGIEIFRLPQLTAPGEVSARDVLPSFRYHPAASELSEDDLQLGFDATLPTPHPALVGSLAQRLGARVPGRLIASAKSWLSHAAVDREAAILPWGADEEVQKVSPVDASASYLAQVRAAWDQAHPGHPLGEQEVVLTVPASFDEAARALTLKAARRAGLPKVRLLEEPQAAFYDWLDRQRDDLTESLGAARLALVLDVGGGTTDLTLIRVELRESGPRLTRVAVGEHLMLGGDNMDLALARRCEPRVVGEGKQLPAARFAQFVQQCREAKEQLLSSGGPECCTVTVLGSGSKLVGGSRSAQLDRQEVHETVLDGFFPHTEVDARTARRRAALVEFGLPYAADAAISRHLAEFLQRHREVAAEALGDANKNTPALPDTVLLNGGVFRGDALRERVLQTLGAWRGRAPRVLDNPDPELAVARGAVAYGLARSGIGLRIGGGSARGYYLQLDGATAPDATPDTPAGVCVLPKGSEEGEQVRLRSRDFALRTGAPVRFRVWSSSADHSQKAGDLLPLHSENFHELPAIAAVLDDAGVATEPGTGTGTGTVKVQLEAALTEVGTLEMSCVHTPERGAAPGEPRERRWKLEFQLRGKAGRDDSQGATRVAQLPARFAEATALVSGYYGKSKNDATPEGRKIKTLRNDLEKLLGARSDWNTAVLRELFGALLAGMKRRRRSADHERIWFNLAGYCLRPGIGYPLDDWRVKQVWDLFGQGVQFQPEAQVWSQWWILWRRIAGGLNADAQRRLMDTIAWYLEPPGPRPRKRPKGPKMQGVEDMVRLAGALEKVPAERKQQVGQWLFKRLESQETSPETWWSIGRLGARAPLHGSAHDVVPPDLLGPWVEKALAAHVSGVGQASFALTQLARFTGDRQRDLPPELRERVAASLEKARCSAAWSLLVREGGELSEADAGRMFGESLPGGLELLG